MLLRILFPLTLLLSTTAVCQKKLVFSDKAYEPQIKSVQFYAGPPHLSADHFHPAATPLDPFNLILEFDDLREEINSYQVYLIHCNADWSKSSLSSLDFLEEYNEFNINTYEYSTNTFVPYVHYTFQIPPVKLPGNYLLVVYRDFNQKDIVLSKRFLVFDNQVVIRAGTGSTGGTLFTSNQQLNFVVNYPKLQLVNPHQSVSVIVRQNDRWDNAKLNVRPSFIREDVRQLEYRFFDTDKFFNAGNEFRFVDFRSIVAPGINTLKTDRSVIPNTLFIQPDKSRAGQFYSQYPDLNGNYIVDNLDWQRDPQSSAYLNVVFSLQASQLSNENVYVIGAFNNWERTKDNQMQYNPTTSSYEATLLLKQGWYNYQYLVDSKNMDSNYFEGNHYQTENVYEVLVYYRPFQPNADLLVGYMVLPVNPR